MMQKRIEWGHEKNKKLQAERGISFEAIHTAIESGHLLKVLPNPNPQYAHQHIMAVDIEGYVYLVPFLEETDRLFLKTAFPSRKATKIYLNKGGENHGK